MSSYRCRMARRITPLNSDQTPIKIASPERQAHNLPLCRFSLPENSQINPVKNKVRESRLTSPKHKIKRSGRNRLGILESVTPQQNRRSTLKRAIDYDFLINDCRAYLTKQLAQPIRLTRFSLVTRRLNDYNSKQENSLERMTTLIVRTLQVPNTQVELPEARSMNNTIPFNRCYPDDESAMNSSRGRIAFTSGANRKKMYTIENKISARDLRVEGWTKEDEANTSNTYQIC